MRKSMKLTVFTITLLFLNTALVGASGVYPATPASSGVGMQSDKVTTGSLDRLCGLLASAKKGDLSFCLGYIKRSKDSNHEIANFILTWSPDAYRKQIPSVFRSKIDRVAKVLRTVDYQELIVDIDFIKNSQLTINQMVKMIKGTKLGR